jgi:ABC-2 type transport system ATP-binding protein
MMTGSRHKRTFSYHRKSTVLKVFVSGIIGMVLLEGSMTLFLVLYFVHGTAIKLIGAALGLLFAYAIVSILRLLSARHELSERGLVVRQGSRFKAFIPRENILKAEGSLERLSGMPAEVRYVPESGLVQVTAGESGLILITLAKPQPTKLAFYRRPVQANAFLVNADEPDEFMAAINEQARAGTTDAAQTDLAATPKESARTRSTPSADYAIETVDLTRTYGKTVAVDRLNLKVRQGEIFGFLGPNGAGKTTTISMLVGLLQPTGGRASVLGVNVWLEPIRAKAMIGYVPDVPMVYERLTGREFLQFMAQLYDAGPSAETRMSDLLGTLDLAEWADQMIKVYSYGMRRKIALAAALVHEPQVLLLDEPTNGLDPKSARRVKDILRQLASQGTTVFMSTHVMEIAERMCDRIAIIQRGKLVAVGTMDELRQQAQMSGADLENVFLSLTGAADDAAVLSEL